MIGKFIKSFFLKQPHLTDKEEELLLSSISENDVVLEYGSGFSTAKMGKVCKKLYSIEHDAKWHQKSTELVQGMDNVEIKFVPPNNPNYTKNLTREDFKDYVEVCTHLGENIDVVFIDGRARVHCAEEVTKVLAHGHRVLIHDWNRKKYHSVLDFYDIISHVDDMVLLKAKAGDEDQTLSQRSNAVIA
jgi:hypothetical protein